MVLQDRLAGAVMVCQLQHKFCVVPFIIPLAVCFLLLPCRYYAGLLGAAVVVYMRIDWDGKKAAKAEVCGPNHGTYLSLSAIHLLCWRHQQQQRPNKLPSFRT